VPKRDWPERLEVVTEFPLDTQGKVRKAQLREHLTVNRSAVQ
jgi:hypothetical protein